MTFHNWQPPKTTIAIADYDRAVALYFNNTDAYISKGIADSAQREHQKAIQDYEEAIAFHNKLTMNNKEKIISLANQASIALEQKNYQTALDNYVQALKIAQ